MSFKYILKDGKVERCDDLLEWAKAFEKGERRVERTVVGDKLVSTMFLGVDHSFGVGEPELFETMVFNNDRANYASHDEYTRRYATIEQARDGHREVITQLESKQHED